MFNLLFLVFSSNPSFRRRRLSAARQPYQPRPPHLPATTAPRHPTTPIAPPLSKKKKDRKQSEKKKESAKKKKRKEAKKKKTKKNPTGRRKVIRICFGGNSFCARRDSPWVTTLWGKFPPPHAFRASLSYPYLSFLVLYYSEVRLTLEREREREYLFFTGIPLYFRKKCVPHFDI